MQQKWNGNNKYLVERKWICLLSGSRSSLSEWLWPKIYQDWWLWLEWFPPVADAYCITYSFSGGSFSMDLENRNENLLSVLFLLFMQLNDISLFFSPWLICAFRQKDEWSGHVYWKASQINASRLLWVYQKTKKQLLILKLNHKICHLSLYGESVCNAMKWILCNTILSIEALSTNWEISWEIMTSLKMHIVHKKIIV